MTVPSGSPRYRFRVHDGNPATLAAFEAGTGGNALSFTSLRRDSDTGASSGPYIEDAPQTAAATVDLVTGHSSVGATTVRVIDAGLGAGGYPPGTIIDPATGLPAVLAAADYFDGVHPAWGNDGTWTIPGKWPGSSAAYPATGEDGSSCLGIAFGSLDGHATKTVTRTFTPAEFPLLQPGTLYTVRVRGRVTYVQQGMFSWGIDVNGTSLLDFTYSPVFTAGTGVANAPCFLDPDPLYGAPTGITLPFNISPNPCDGFKHGSVIEEIFYGGWQTFTVTQSSDPSGNLTIKLGAFSVLFGTSIPFQGGDLAFDNLEIYPGSPATPGGVVTTHIGDDTGCSLLLSRRAVVEVADESDCSESGGVFTYADPLTAPTYRQLQSGYVNRYHLANALVWEFTVGDTRREEENKLWQTVTADDGATCIIGGPVKGGFGQWAGGGDLIPDYDAQPSSSNRWQVYRVDTTDADSLGNVRKIVVLQFVRGWLRPYYAGVYTQVLGREADEINKYAAPFYVDNAESWHITGQTSQHFGFYPGLAVDAVPVSSGAAFITRPITRPVPIANLGAILSGTGTHGRVDLMVETNHNGLMYVDWPESDILDADGNVVTPGMGTAPTVGWQFDLVVYGTKISAQNPVHLRGHPIDIHTAYLAQQNIPYDATSATNTKAALGDLYVDMRETESQKLGAWAESRFQGLFGYSIRIGTNAERVFFPTRVRSFSPVQTITINDLRGTSKPIWDIEEASVVNGVDVTVKTFRRFDVKTDEAPREPDDLIIGESPVEGTRHNQTIFGDRRVAFSFPGTIGVVVSGTVVPMDLRAFVEQAGGILIDKFGCGAPYTEIECLPSVVATIGDEVDLTLPHLPVPVVGGTPAVVRGGTRTMIVVSRQETPAGPNLRCVDAGSLSQSTPIGTPPGGTPGATDPVPTITIAASVSDPTTIGTVTVTNASTIGALNLDVSFEYAVSASTPAGSGTAFGPLLGPSSSNDTIDTPAVAPGSHLWVRAQADDLGGHTSAWSSWVDVILTAQTVGGPGASPAVPMPSLSATIDATTGQLDALASVAAVVTSVKFAVGAAGGTAPTVSAVRAATADSSAPFTAASLATMAAGETRTIGALAYDAAGNESTLATLTVTRGGSAGGVTSITATAPINASASTGAVTLSHDASGVSAGTYGDATHSPQITVDAEGHITAVTDVAISGGGGGGSYSFFDPDLPQGSPSSIDDDCDGVSPPTSTDVLNSQATADYTSYPGFLALIPTAQVNAPRARTYALPSGDGRWQCHFTLPSFLYRAGNLNYYFGVLLSTSNSYGSGKQALFILTYYNNSYQWYRQKYDNWSTFTSAPEGPAISSYDGGEFWFRMTRSGTDWTWELSGDGAYFDKTNDTPYSESSLVSGTVTDIAPFILCNGTRRPPGLIRGIRYNSNPATVFGGIRTI